MKPILNKIKSSGDLTIDSTSLFSDYRRKVIFLLVVFILLILGAVIAITRGVYEIAIPDVFGVIGYHMGLGSKPSLTNEIIVWEIRLPRVLLAIAVGMALAVAGAIFQGIFRNPLVEPYILGVSSGAACGAAISIVLAWSIISLQLTAFLFGMLAIFLAYSLATVKKETPLINLILAGIIVSALFSAVLSYLKITAGSRQLYEIVFWLMGGFDIADWADVGLLFPLITVSTMVLWALGWKLNVLTMGDDEARSLGISVGKTKVFMIFTATFITSISVATVGIVAWVGLMIPHMARMTIGPDHRFLIPASAIMGGLFMVFCDTLARTLIMGEIPISILTSVVGAPYLIYLIRTNRKLYFG